MVVPLPPIVHGACHFFFFQPVLGQLRIQVSVPKLVGEFEEDQKGGKIVAKSQKLAST